MIRERSLMRGREYISPVPKDIDKTFLSGRKIHGSLNIFFLTADLKYDDSLEFKVFNALESPDPDDKFLFSFEENGYDFFLFVGKKVDNCR